MPGLTFMQEVLGLNRVPHSLTYGCITQMGNLMRTSPLSKYIASVKTRRNVCTQAKLWRWNKPRARAAGVHHYRWHECQVYHKRLAELLSAKKGEDYSTTIDILDKNQNLICHSENNPPMLKGIALNEESKSQPKRDGLWHRKRTLRTLDFDLEKRYWILHIQLLLLFNILIVVGSCWNRGRF